MVEVLQETTWCLYPNLGKDLRSTLEKQWYPIGFKKNLYQNSKQYVQEYETAFQNHAMVPNLDLKDHDLFTKFVEGLHNYV